MSTSPTFDSEAATLPVATRAASNGASASEADLSGDPVAAAVAAGLRSTPKTLPPWLFYDAEGSRLFERITLLPEYYLTRTERTILTGYADAILAEARGPRNSTLRIIELGAGTASKTGILLNAAVAAQGETLYLPIDVSASAMEEACSSIQRTLPQVVVQPQIANYVTDALSIPGHDGPTLGLYIGSSIGNFSPGEAVRILANLRAQMRPGDSLLLGTDLVKDEGALIAAYNDASGTTAAFNLNVLRRMNRELQANFDLASFCHSARWNQEDSRVEMHLQSTCRQTVRIPPLDVTVFFLKDETIHTENSYKFTTESVAKLLREGGFRVKASWVDERSWYAVTLASAE